MLNTLLSNLPQLAIILAGVLYVIGIAIVVYHFFRFGPSTERKDLKSYEVILLSLRRHWFTLVIKILAYALLALIPPFTWLIAGALMIGLPAELWTAFFIIYGMAWSYGLFYIIVMYFLDFWIVTDHRIIDSEQHGFFNHTEAELGLHKIQDISVQIAGVIPTFLDFGNLEVQTAAAMEKFFFKQIPHPDDVKDAIMEAHNQFIELHPNDVEIHEVDSPHP